MAIPDRLNWINQGVTALADVLRSSTEFMHSSVLDGGNGVVVQVDEHELDRSLMDKNAVIYASIRYDAHKRDPRAAGANDYWLTLQITLEGKMPVDAAYADRQTLWKVINRAAAVINFIINREVGPSGSKFDNYSYLASPEDGKATDFEDDEAYYAIIETGAKLMVTLLDVE